MNSKKKMIHLFALGVGCVVTIVFAVSALVPGMLGSLSKDLLMVTLMTSATVSAITE